MRSMIWMALAVTMAACSGDQDAGPGDTGPTTSDSDVEAAFCDVLANGAEQDVTAVDGAGGPEVFYDETKIEIELLDDGGGLYSGSVSFTPDEDGSFALGLGDDVPLEVVDETGAVIPFDTEVVGAACPELAIRYTVSLTTKTYTLNFGPTDVGEIDFVAEESDDDL